MTTCPGMAQEFTPQSLCSETGPQIAWRSDLPNWSNGNILVDHDKVFVCSEPLDYAPILSCLHARTGALLWQTELDPIAACPADQQAELRSLAQELWRWRRLVWSVWHQIRRLHEQEPALFTKQKRHAKPNAAGERVIRERFGEKLSELQVSFHGFNNLFIDMRVQKSASTLQAKLRTLERHGLKWEYWSAHGPQIGLTFSAPLSDGQYVYTITGNLLWSCHTVDGALVWQRRFPWPMAEEAQEHIKTFAQERLQREGRCAWPYNSKTGWSSAYRPWLATNALLLQGQLVSMHGAMLRSLDPRTGALQWELPLRGSFGMNCPALQPVHVDGEYYLIVPASSGRTGLPGDDIVRLRDGRIAGLLPGFGQVKNYLQQPFVCGSLVVNARSLPGKKRSLVLAGHALRLDGEQLTVEQRWTLSDEESKQFKPWGAAVSGALLCTAAGQLHVQTGTLSALRDVKKGFAGPWSSHTLHKDYVFSMDHRRGAGLFTHRQRQESHSLSLSSNVGSHPDGSQRIQDNCTGETWPVFGASLPVFTDDRLYLRSCEFLWCLEQ